MPAKCLKASGTHAAFKDKTIRSENLSFLSLMTIFTSSITMCNFYAIMFPLFIHSYVFKCVGVNVLCHRLRKSLFHCTQGCLGENFHVWCVKNKEILKPNWLLTVKSDGTKENIQLKISPNYFHVFPYLAYIHSLDLIPHIISVSILNVLQYPGNHIRMSSKSGVTN